MQKKCNRFKKLEIKIIKKRKKKKKEERKKGKLHRTAKAQRRGRDFLTKIKSVMNIHIYIYTHKQNQNSPPKIKYHRLTQRTMETKNYICQLRTKLTKAQTGKQN